MTARQRRLWEQWVLDPAAPWHTVPFTIALEGPVDRDRLERALAAFPQPEVPVPGVRLTPRFLLRDHDVEVTLPAQCGTPAEFVRATADAYLGRTLGPLAEPSEEVVTADDDTQLGRTSPGRTSPGRTSGPPAKPSESARVYWESQLADLPDTRLACDGDPGAESGVADCGFGDAAPDSVLAALAAVLGRWTRSRTLVIGVPEGVVRVDLNPSAALGDLIDQIGHRRALGRLHTGDADQVLEDAGIRCLPAVHFADTPSPLPSSTAGDLTMTPEVPPYGVAGSTLTLTMDRACFDARMIAPATVERLLGQIRLVLKADPGERLSALSLMGEAERALVIGGFSRTADAMGTGRVLHDLVAGPDDAVAVVCGAERITYGELDRRSSLLALRLRDLGVRTEDVVGVRLPRSVGLIVAFLGVLKAGGAYLPLDPGYPDDRIAFMTEDAGAKVVIDSAMPASSDTWTIMDASDLAEARPAVVPEVRPGVLPEVGSEAAPQVQLEAVPEARHEVVPKVLREAFAQVRPDQLAYVIYTSGSSGRPKGVQVEHRQIVASTTARYPIFPGPYDSYLALAGPAFDALGAGIYLTLTRGGMLVLPTQDEVGDPWLLGELIKRERVTHFDGVPGQYAAVLDAAPDAVAGLRCAVVAGEACPPALVARHNELTNDAVLINEYGPTETTVWAVCHVCDRESPPGATVPIGRPVPGALAYVLDERLEPVPIGVPGELCIGGATVARGYIGRPDLTASRFVDNPFDEGLVYRTGDLVRWLPGGDLEFLGRIDQQIKIRGFRVEPAEVESVLAKHPGVQEAAVVPKPAGDHYRLVAYVVGAGDGTLTQADLAAYARETLPDHMVPTVWEVLDRMPRTRNGKVDRAALPPPSRTAARGATEPRTPLQLAVVELFTSALGQQANLESTVPAWIGRFSGPATVAALLKARFRQFPHESLPQITPDLSAGRLASALRRLDIKESQ